MRPIPFFVLLLFAVSTAQQPVEIGRLTTRAHDVSGTVFALNSRQLRVEGLDYDGQGPAAFFWVGEGDTPSSDGIRVPFRDNCSIPSRLSAYDDAIVELELPDNLQLADIGHFAVWCEAVDQNFGEVVIDADALQGVPTLEEPACGGAAAGMMEPFPVQEDWNCEPLSDDFQVRWVVNGSTVAMELVGRIDDSQYMGFGVSGDDDKTNMNFRCVKCNKFCCFEKCLCESILEC